jgi:integrase
MRLDWYRGRWYVAWVEKGGTRRISCGTTDRREAEVFLRDFIAGQDAPPAPDRITVEDACAYYLKQLPEHKATRQGWNLKPIRRHMGELKVDQITRLDCRNYLALRVREKPTLSKATLRDELCALRSALIRCEKDRVIPSAPWIEAPGKPEPRERWLTKEEVVRLYGAVQVHHLWMFVALALNTGARSGAILELTWDRVDMRNGLIDYRVPGRERTKKGRAIVPMNDWLRRALEAVPEEHRRGPVVTWGAGSVKSVKRAFRETCRRAELEGVTPHTLRHTFATHAAMAGVDMRKLARAMGHEDPRMTERYAKHSPDYLRDVVDVVPFGSVNQKGVISGPREDTARHDRTVVPFRKPDDPPVS